MTNREVGPNRDGKLQLAWHIQIEVAGSDLRIDLPILKESYLFGPCAALSRGVGDGFFIEGLERVITHDCSDERNRRTKPIGKN